jgi:hypothetical protein
MENENNSDTKGTPIDISVDVPYLSLYHRIITEAESGEDVVSITNDIISGKIKWENIIQEYKDDIRMHELMVVSLTKTEEAEGFIQGLLLLSASNTYLNTKKEVLLTGSRVYTNLSLMQRVWEVSNNKTEMPFNPVLSLEKEGFHDTIHALSSALSVIPVGQDISYLHGTFSKDTWNILNGIIGTPVTTQMYGANIDSNTELLGGLLLFGDAIESLASVVEKMSNSDSPHIKKDMEKIKTSFRDRDEETHAAN